MASHQSKNTFSIYEVAPVHFDQKLEADNIAPFVNQSNKLINIGGGHDHILPFLMAINKSYKKITVINIDAHLDTRIDKVFHSGTPFRQFSENVEGEFHLIQFGIHNFANPDSNYEKLKTGKMDIITYDSIKQATENFSKPAMPILNNYLQKKYNQDHAIVFSLDCDAISSSVIEAVSAVNHQGLPFDLVHDLLTELVNLFEIKYFGFYEFNPLYDGLSEKGSRAIARLIYDLLER
jgi:formiminoglutamase